MQFNELAVLYEISAESVYDNVEHFFDDIVDRAGRLFGVERLILDITIAHERFFLHWGFGSKKPNKKPENRTPNTFINNLDELGYVYFEKQQDFTEVEGRLLYIYTQQLEKALSLLNWKKELKKSTLELERTNLELAVANEQLVAIEDELRYNVKALEKHREELELAHQKLEDIIEFLPDATFVIDQDKKVIAWNKAIELITNIKKADILGTSNYAYAIPFYEENQKLLVDYIGVEDNIIAPEYNNFYRTGNTLHAEICIQLNGQSSIHLHEMASPLYNKKGEIVGAIGSVRNITDRKMVVQRLHFLSLHDSLTGLYNRTYFEQEMNRIEVGRFVPVTIILSDVDGLKLINDTMGHSEGDELLDTVAKVIRSCFRQEDMVARIGGDEFAILLPNTDEESAQESCNRIRQAIERYNAQEPNLLLSVSIGYAVRTSPDVLMNDLFKEADNNVYREKLHRSQSARSAIVNTLMKALEERDYITEGHADRLQVLVVNLAQLLDLPSNRINDLRTLAQFHDIGKVGIPDRILFKKGPLIPEEYAEMKRHCEIGYRIAQASPDLAHISEWILRHHEWWNGQGYPLGLKGEEIPLECRILAIADAYDAMVSGRPYREALAPEEAAKEIIRCAGTQFDPRLAARFLESLRLTTSVNLLDQ
ncbi:MAG: diguanylate cyclase [Desulforudis sp.]|nr:MAG: diguanylate cyclase [Desulforudis sp.]